VGFLWQSSILPGIKDILLLDPSPKITAIALAPVGYLMTK